VQILHNSYYLRRFFHQSASAVRGFNIQNSSGAPYLTDWFHAVIGRVGSHKLCATSNSDIQETQLSLTNRATHKLCKCNGVADLKHDPPRMSYNAEFGRSVLKDVGINIAEPPNWGNAGTLLS